MRKNYSSNYMISKILNVNRVFVTTLAFALVLLAHKSGFSQTSTEQFETESSGSSSFTDNGVIFNIISYNGIFDTYVATNGGWNGTAKDNRFIDNSGEASIGGTGNSFSIKTTSNLFKVNRFWIYLASSDYQNQNVTGNLTVTGKMSGVTKFTQTKTTGFTATTGIANGYTLIDMTNLNGQNYSNIVIDELRITLGGNYVYAALDAFTWVKDAGVLPVSLTDFNASLSKAGVLKADWKTASEQNNSHFIVQSSVDGKVWKDLGRKDAVENATTGATYHFETNIGVVSMAGFGILSILLLPFSKRSRNRYRYLAMLAVIAVVITSCAKDKNELMNTKGISGDSSDKGTIYVRLAQVDLDGTTTYSDVVSVKAK